MDTNQDKKLNAWDQVDERCPTCNAVTKEAKGFNKQNVSKLLSFKIDTPGFINLILMLACAGLIYYVYILLTNQAPPCPIDTSSLQYINYTGVLP
jgi:hypothetical protein